MTFDAYNTEGYTQGQLDALNAEWEAIVDEQSLEEGSDEYNAAESEFSDEVARR